jgi:hypothetical protein
VTKKTGQTREPKHAKTSDQMRAWSSALEAEVADWPHASARSFFGFTALYRKEKIFAMLPRTRAWETGTSIVFKLQTATPAILSRLEKDPRIGFTLTGKTRWYTFELASDADLHAALDWIGVSYTSAGKKVDKNIGKKDRVRKKSH